MPRRTLAALLIPCLPALAAADYIAAPHVQPGGDDAPAFVSGSVFEDLDRDGRRGEDEAGVEGVLVSNGLDWTTTDADGSWRIAAREDMNLTLVQPRGWRVPTDERRVPQFFHVHKAGGTPETLRYGGLPDTGPLPARIDFPLVRRDDDGTFRCVVVGDSQAYSNREIGWLRDGAITEAVESAPDCVLYVGDVVGDDLGLLDRLLEVGSAAGAPQWLVHGNHDFDFDASSDAHSADSWRRIVGPNYYAFERGDVLFVVLDNVIYPCGEHEADARHDFCGNADRPTYNGRIDDTQMQWLEGLLERTPGDRRVVIATHIPLVSFADPESRKHQTDNAGRLHELLAGRPALSLSGHTHTIENHAPGQHFGGWTEAVGVEPLPFRHIVAGAGSGAWYQGDFNIDGNPMALQRMGAPPGVLLLDFDGTDYVERYVGARIGDERRMWLGLNTPAFRDWFGALVEWEDLDRDERHPLPPYSVNDLADTGIITPQDLAEGVWLTANVWDGSAETRVAAMLPGGRELALGRTQSGDGEAPRIGAEWADPFAAERQLSVARFALTSRLGEPRAQGFELFKGSDYGPAFPQPQGAIADRNMHLWRARLPEDLPPGVHAVEVAATDRHGRTATATLVFEIRRQRPPPYFRSDVWYGED
jgi:hypothetical protein